MKAEDSPTGLLHAWSEGDRAALDDLVALVHGELRRMCRSAMVGERMGHTLQPTAVLNEVYMRLVSLRSVSWESRTPFFAFAARLMRRVLVEHARAVQAKKRGGEQDRVDVRIDELPAADREIDVLVLDDVLARLEQRDPLVLEIIELRFFGGLTERETAEALGLSRSKVQREWRIARRWLARELGTDQSQGVL